MNILTEEVSRESEWFRIHPQEFGWKWFGPAPGNPPTNRYDAPNGEYRTCYFGCNSFDAAFAEKLLRYPKKRLLDLAYLATLQVTRVKVVKPIVLARAYGQGLGRLGVTATEIHGKYRLCQDLSLALWNHKETVDGIAYLSRMDTGETCVALFDRAENAVVEIDTVGLLDDRHRLGKVCTAFDVGLG